jgi:hypothetical protein
MLSVLNKRVGSDVSVEVDTTEGTWHVWAPAMWKRAVSLGKPYCLLLNDDLILPEWFWRDLELVIKARPDQVINLYNTHPVADFALSKGIRWLTSFDGLIGNAYVFPTEDLKDFLSWREEVLTFYGRRDLTEDQQINLWAMCKRRLVYHTVPALVDHETSIPSLYGNTQFRKPHVGPKDLDGDRETGGKNPWMTGSIHVGRIFRGNHQHLLTKIVRGYIREYGLIDRYWELDGWTPEHE